MASTSTTSSELDAALSAIPHQFRTRIIKTYLEVKKRYKEAAHDAEWDTSGLSAGKFCETVLRFLQKHLTDSYTPFGTTINFEDECRKLVTLPKTAGVEALRVIMPRALAFLYTLRNKRAIGHVGGDVEANEIDAATTARLSDWVVCELIRVFHGLSLEEAQVIVDAIALRALPDIWSVGGKKRVLKKGLSYKQKTLLLLYGEPDAVLTEDLVAWTEYSNASTYRKDVLKPLHKDRLVEYDAESELVYLSPLGIQEVEKNILGDGSL
jgi:hypothetical protein